MKARVGVLGVGKRPTGPGTGAQFQGPEGMVSGVLSPCVEQDDDWKEKIGYLLFIAHVGR